MKGVEIHQGAGGTRRSGLGDTPLFLEPQSQGSSSVRFGPSVCSLSPGPCAEPQWGPWIQSGGRGRPDMTGRTQGGPHQNGAAHRRFLTL